MMIKVYVIKMAGRKYLQHQWTDPNTGRLVTRSSKETTRRAAERAAEQMEKTLNRVGRPVDGSMPWSEFRQLFGEQYLAGRAHKTRQQFESILNQFQLSQEPSVLKHVSTMALSSHAAWMRGRKRSEDTIKSHMRHLKVVVRWAFGEGYLPDIPKIPATPRATKRGTLAKGRPLTPDEVRRFAEAAAKAESSKHAPESWADLIRGLDVSGLRLGEALVLTWDNPELISIDLSDPKRIKLVIPSEHEKSHEGTLYPTTPDFSDFLLARSGPRTGYVFNALHSLGKPTRSVSVASHVLSEIGQASGVLISPGQYCTAHDLRRSFGFRWALIKTPPIALKSLMRHQSLATTEKYYIGDEATRIQDEVYRVWEAAAKRTNTLANSQEEDQDKTQQK